MFSVVIPLYNKQSCIRDTVQSVLNQTFPDFEINIVDDGSTDNSMEVVRQFKDPRIRVFSQPNGGVSSARNYGIRQSREKYIAFLDADDLWHPDYLSEIARLIHKYPGCGLYSSGYILNKKHRKIKYFYPAEGVIKDYFKEYYKNKTPFCHTSCVVTPSTVFTKVGYFPQNLHTGEDIYMWIAIAKQYDVCVTPNILMSYEYQESTFRNRIKKNIYIPSDLFRKLYDPENWYLNEIIAFWVIKDAVFQAMRNNKSVSKPIAKEFDYTRLNRKRLFYLRILNRIPSWGLWTIRKGWRAGSAVKTLLCGMLGK